MNDHLQVTYHIQVWKAYENEEATNEATTPSCERVLSVLCHE